MLKTKLLIQIFKSIERKFAKDQYLYPVWLLADKVGDFLYFAIFLVVVLSLYFQDKGF